MSDDKEKEQPTTNGNTFQSAFWSGEVCNLCRVTCPTDADKALHSDNSAHMKRRNIHDFLKKCSSLKVSCAESAIARRYSYCQEKVIGVECVFELSFSWCKTGWWACSLCYESGSNFDQLDEHLHGRRHLTTYIDELHPEWKIGQADVDTMISSKDTIFDEEQEGKVLPPEVLQLELSKEQAWVNLVLIEKTPPYKIIADNAQELDHMFCEVCYEVIPCRRESSAGGPARTYAVHSLTSSHRAALTIKAAVDMCNPVEEVDESAGDDVDLEWKKSEKGDLVQPLQGPVCGIRHLVVFGRKCLCTLCFCLVGSLEEHFSSESHILKYVSTLKPGKGYFYTNCSRETRRVELLNQLNKKNLGNELSRQCDLADIPKVIKELAYEGTLPPPDFMPTPHPLNLKQKAMFCEACWRVLSMDSSDNLPLVWETHIASIEHLTLSAKRGEYFFDDHYFVCMASKVTLPPKQLKGLWKNVGTEEEPKYLQDQSDVALEYVVQDVLNDELVCTLCAEVYERGNEKELGTHIRSLDHLTQYLQVCNRELYSALVCHENTPVILEMAMDWLQRAVTTACDDIKVYHPVLATKMESWQRVPMKMIESSHLDPEHRTVYECVQSLLDATDDNVDRQAVDCSLREALVFSSMLIVQIQEKVRGHGHVDILFKCTACELVFSTSDDRVVEDIWEKHMRNEEHFRRWKVFSDNRMDAFDFAPTSSSHKVSSFVQTDPKKVIAWQYNAADKTYDFVLRIVGQEELVERRSLPNKAAHVPDFFCSLCAISFPRRSYVLESHIRSHTHVYNYAQKHFPMEIPRLEQLPKDDGGKRLRKELALLLRDVKAPSEYCIAVYDPCGEQERRGIVALQKAKEADRQRQMDEMRKAAAEKRKEQDEERRKRREIELEREKRDQERRAREEREARARYEEQRETKEKLKQLVLAKKKELEEEKRKVDKEKERIKEKEKARMKEQLEREKQRLRELKEKKQKAAIEAEQARLKKELEELQRRKEEDRIRKTVPAPSLIIPNIGFKIATKSLEGNAAPLFASTSNNVFSTTPVAASIASLTTSSAFGNSTIGPCPPPNMSGIGMHIGMQTSAAPQMVPSSVWNIVPAIRPSLMNACVDPCILDPIIIRTREQLVDYMWRRGTVPIPAEEMPEKFSNLVLGTEGLLGLETVYEVCCIDDPKLDSFYCVLCNHWTMPKPMLDHLKEPAHIQAFLQKHYMVYYQAVQTESDESMRSALLQQFAIAIWQKDRPQKPVYLRLSQVLNRRVLDRLWPDHYRFIDHAWLDQPFGGAAMQPAGVDVSDDDLEGTPMDDHQKKKRKRRGGSRQKAKEKEREKEKREREKKEKKELERKEKERKEREEREREEEKERERKEKEKKEKERRAREREELERVRREKEEKQRQLDILKEVERRKHEEAIKRQQQQQEEERRLAEERQRVEQEELERRRAHELEMRRQHELRMQMQQSEQERIELQKAELLRQREELQRLQAEVERKRIEELEKIAVRQREAELQMKLDMEAHAALLREAEKEAARREEKERKRKQKKEEEAKAAKEREKAEKAAAKEREKREKERKEREAKEARSRKRSRSRSRDKSKRSTSVERKRKSRSRSRERKDREKSARSTRSSERKKAERTEPAVPSSSSLGKNLSWEESAAAFLAKIGGTQQVQSPSKEPSRKRRTSHRRSPSPAKRRTKEDTTKASVDVASEQQRVRSDSVSTTSSQPAAGSASAKVAPQQALDPNQKLRKMLGLIIMMQKEAEQRGGLEESVVDELYNEMGLSRGDVSESNDMMGQLCSLLGGGGSQKRDANIDLSKFGISKESSIESTTPTVTPAHAASMPSSHVPSGQSGAVPSASTVDFYRSVASSQGNVIKTAQVAAPAPVSAPMAMAPQHQQPSTSRPPVQSHPYVSEYQSTPTYSDSPAYNSPAQSTSTVKAPAPAPASGSGGLNLPPHLMSMLSGLKGSLQTLEQMKKQQEPAPTQYQGYSHKPMEEPSSLFSSHLVINRPEDVFGDSDEISYVYPARDDLETGESAARRQTIVRDYAKDYEDYQNIQQYHQEKEQQHQQMLQKQRQQQLHHQLQLQKQQEQEEQMMQNQPPQKKKAKQGRHLPKELMNGNPAKDPRMQLVDWSKTWWPGSTLPPPWCVVMNYMHLLPFSYEEYGKAKLYLCEGRLSAKKTGKMRQQLADMGFNRDAFTYTVVGPIPIPGMSLHGGSEEPLHQRPHSGASQNDGNGVRNPESGAKRGQPSVGTSHNPVVLDDEDWEGVEDNLEKILQEEQRKLQEQQQYSKYNFLHLSAKAGVDVMAPKPSGPNSGHGWPKTPYKPEPMRRGTADVPVRKEASVADAEQESWRQPVLPPKGMLGGTSSTPVDPRIGTPPPTTVPISSAPSVLSTTQSSAVSGQGPKTVTSSVGAPAAKPVASKPTPATPAAAAKKPAPPAKQAVVNRKALPSLLATEAPPPPRPTTEPVDPYAYHPPQVTQAAHVQQVAQPQYYGPTDPNYQPANVYGAGMYDAAMGQPQVGYTAMPMQPQQAYGAYPQQPDPYQQQQDPYQQQQGYAYDPSAYAQYYGQGGYYQ